jgi:hypothetical protein
VPAYSKSLFSPKSGQLTSSLFTDEAEKQQHAVDGDWS